MGTPRKNEILEKAVELYMKDDWRNGTKACITPTEDELKEGHYFETARQILMTTNPNVVFVEKEAKSEKEEIGKGDLEVDTAKLLESGCYVCGTSGSGKSHLVMYVVDKLMKKGVIVYIVDPSQDWLRNSSISLAVTVPENLRCQVYNSSTIYDTSLLTVKMQRAFAESLCKVIMSHSKQQREEERVWRVIVFEEAQLVFPEGCFRALRNDYSIQLASMGRNFKVRFIAITPFSANVDKMLVKITGQRYFGWTCEKNDSEYLKGFLGSNVSILPTLKSGQFVYHAPALGKLETISIEPHKPIIISQKPL